jgi:hypothetical protein
MTSSRARSASRKPTPAAVVPSPEPAEPPATSPLFLPPEDLPPAELTTLPESLQPADSSFSPPSSQPPAGEDSASPSATPSTPADTKPTKAPRITRAGIRKHVRAAVAFAGVRVHAVLTAQDPYGKQAGLWMPDPDDVDAIAEPAAGLIARRLPDKVGGAMGNPDVEDGIALLFALADYIGKQLGKRAELIAQRMNVVDPEDLNPEVVTA